MTDAITKACKDLEARGEFNGFQFIELRPPISAAAMAEDYIADGYPQSVADTAARDYAMMAIHLDTYVDSFSDLPEEYVSVELDITRIERELREFLLGYLGGEESLLPDIVSVEGHEMEFIRRGPFSYRDTAVCVRDSKQIDGSAICEAGHEYEISRCFSDGSEWLVEISGELHRAADFANKDLRDSVLAIESKVFCSAPRMEPTKQIQKKIALDFDDTYTADPELWSAFVKLAIHRGHQVYCVTARHNTEENTDAINEAFEEQGIQLPIIFSNMGSKADEVQRRGLKIDIWCDDSPWAIVNGV